MSPAQTALEHVRRLVPPAAAPPGSAPALARARVTATFHPDRPGLLGYTAATGLAHDGGYGTQFETGTSAGGLDTVLRGARTRWEHGMFGNAYDGVAPAERPRYGGLDLLPYRDGACPRFGSTHLRLRPEVLARCTFSWGDSVTEPSTVGTWDRLHAVLAAAAAAGAPELGGRVRTGADRLDGYVEAQIHGGLHMRDVEVVVTDPAYRGTAVERSLERACKAHGATLEWHEGYALPPQNLDPRFRGPEAVRLGHEVSRRFQCETLDPEVLGRAAGAVVTDPASWDTFGGVTETLQQLKYLWHHLAAFGYRYHFTPTRLR